MTICYHRAALSCLIGLPYPTEFGGQGGNYLSYALVVERNTPGFSIDHIENKMGIRSTEVSELILNDVRVPAENMLAKSGKGLKLTMKTLDGGRIGVAAPKPLLLPFFLRIRSTL